RRRYPRMFDIPTRYSNCQNLIGGAFSPGSGQPLDVLSPYTGAAVGQVRLSTEADVDAAVSAAHAAWPSWRRTPLRERIEPMLRLRGLIIAELDSLSSVAAAESGKTPAEARAGIQRGVEVIDFAASLLNSDPGGALDVSRGVSCEYRRDSLGVVVGITPFNFPA